MWRVTDFSLRGKNKKNKNKKLLKGIMQLEFIWIEFFPET